MVTRAQLYELFPGARRDIVEAIVAGWQANAVPAGLIKPRRVRQFFANIGAETGGLTILEESLNYTTAERIREVWPDRFPTLKSAASYVGQPRKLGNHVYGGRMGNAPEPSNDGYNYRGGGLLQATGKGEYVKLGYGSNPDVLRRDPMAAFKTACKQWVSYSLNTKADRNDTKGIRKRINGGYNGLAETEHFFALSEAIWPDGSDVSSIETTDDRDVVEEAQRKLFALGYTEVGRADGEVGKYTQVAIDAFRSDNGLLQGGVDDEFLDTLDRAKPRQTSRTENPPTNSEVRSFVPEVLSNFYNKLLAGIIAVFSFLGTLLDVIKDNFSTAEQQIAPVQQYFSNVPGWAWFGLISIVSLTIYMISQHGESQGVQAFKTGQRR